MTHNRHRFRIILAMQSWADVHDFTHEIARRLTERFGGCTILEGTGYWAPDGDQHKTTYSAPMVEPCRVVEVVTEYNAGSHIIGLVRLAADAVFARDNKFDATSQWIHFEHELIHCEHFQIT